MTNETEPDHASPPASLALKLAGAWTLVGLPLAWGVWQVIHKSLDLFK
jgi:hypothetical protein